MLPSDLIQHHMEQENQPAEAGPFCNLQIVNIMKWLCFWAIKFGMAGYTEIDGHNNSLSSFL